MTESPKPTRDRWQPLRAGLVDLFYYDVEEFRFHDGRLLLRGNNGTGKSKVLALLLPFLLDGDLSPHRVEPDADPRKRMDWNLLLGGEHPHPERLGYSWIEFGRLDDDGSERFCTLGCGMKAVSGRGIVRHWFFVTDQRVGEELALVDATGTALTRERLADALAGRGALHGTARSYRRAVDETLFGLGEQRYGALVDLLVNLRQPQLSKRPSEKALSAALTESLPPLDQAVVADVAEAFRSLEADRDELTAMTEARDGAVAFLAHYRHYAAVGARRRAAGPRSADARHRSLRTSLTEVEEEYARADAAVADAGRALAELTAEAGRLRARDESLRAGPEMRSARELERAREDARRCAADAARAGRERDAASHRLAQRSERRTDAARRAEHAASALDVARENASGLAARALIGAEHAREVDAPLDPPGDGSDADESPAYTGAPDRYADARRLADSAATRQERAVAHLAERHADAAHAERIRGEARNVLDRLDAESAEVAETRAGADDEAAARAEELLDAVRAHLHGLAELVVPDPPAVLAELESWTETLDGPDPVRVAIDEAGRVATAEIARVEAALDQREAAGQDQAEELRGEIRRCEAGEDEAPPVPHTRDPAARQDRPGSPLWQLVDFVDGVDVASRAGVEAALEAAGILDAWLAPDGRLTDDEDVVLEPAGAPRPERSLVEVLRPAVDRRHAQAGAVDDETVTAVLAAVALGDPDERPADGLEPRAAVDVDGRFRLGVLRGAWNKPAARYIGRGARDAARRTRLQAARDALADVESELAGIAAQRGRLAGRRRAAVAEITATPPTDTLRSARARAAALAAQHAALIGRRDAALEAVSAATAAAAEAVEAVRVAAEDLGLPADAAALDEVREGLRGYRLALAALWPAATTRDDARARSTEAADELAAAREELDERGEHAATTGRLAAAAAERESTLESSVGATVAELNRLLAEVSVGQERVESERGARARERECAVADRGRAEGRRDELVAALTVAAEQRDLATESLRRFATTGLLAVALPDLVVPDTHAGWAVDPALRLARHIEQELTEVPDDDPAWERAQRRLNDELKTLTDVLARRGNTATAQSSEDGVVVEVVFHGRPTSVPELAGVLEIEVTDRERLLDEREREILENHLVNEVASTLQELMTEAEHQVRRMNHELAERPTSTGMRLRLVWRPREDGPAGLEEARGRLLRQSSDAWSEEDRAAVGGFLQARIAEERAGNPTGTWLEHLATALDYRSWNQFVIQRHQNGQWRAASGPASGGERVLAASVPLFAAASSHYASAGNQYAPRLVTLDEAFAGVDDHARAKYLGLLAAFDLDVVMTSEREWGCYPEVPGLAIAQLARAEGIPAVLVTSWRWDGRALERASPPATTGLPDLTPAATGTGAPGLWADGDG
jgi:uncharacterized protein (TIGR02680 family)